jgi:hypothetical protein
MFLNLEYLFIMKEIKEILYLLIGLTFDIMSFVSNSHVFSVLFGILGILWLIRALIEINSKDEKTD